MGFLFLWKVFFRIPPTLRIPHADFRDLLNSNLGISIGQAANYLDGDHFNGYSLLLE